MIASPAPPVWPAAWEPIQGPRHKRVHKERPDPLLAQECACWPAGVVPEPAIALPVKRGDWHWVLISPADAWALEWNWFLTAEGYPFRNHQTRSQYLYRLIGWLQRDLTRTPTDLTEFFLPQTIHVDHKDRNTLNNHRLNLRLVDASMNNLNTQRRDSGLEGAHWDERRQLWQAKVKHQGKTQFLGRFGTEQQAHRVAMARKERIIAQHTKQMEQEHAAVPF